MTIKYYEAIHEPDNPYWDIKCLKKLLSHKADVYIAQSPRNYGKTYSAKQLVYETLLKGESVAWGRYNKPELSQAITDLTKNLPNLVPLKIPDSHFKWYQDECTGGCVCFFTWSIAQNAKGMDHPFKYMICDEFIPERYTNKTRMDTEFKDWDSVRKSIVRSYGTIPILLSNNIYWQNPFFLKWDIPAFSKGQILKKVDVMEGILEGEHIKETRTIVIENVAGTPALIKRNIREQLLSFNSSEEMQAYFNNETKQEYTTIGSCPNPKQPLQPMLFMTEGYYFGLKYYEGTYYFQKVKPHYDTNTFVAEPQYVDERINHYRQPKITSDMEEWFNSGKCVFDKAETLNAFYRFLRNNRTRVS